MSTCDWLQAMRGGFTPRLPCRRIQAHSVWQLLVRLAILLCDFTSTLQINHDADHWKRLMNRFLAVGLLTGITALGAQVSVPPVVFNKDVLPVLQRGCQVCHRPGGAGPMSFLTYESTRPWAKAIKQKVVRR